MYLHSPHNSVVFKGTRQFKLLLYSIRFQPQVEHLLCGDDGRRSRLPFWGLNYSKGLQR